MTKRHTTMQGGAAVKGLLGSFQSVLASASVHPYDQTADT
jgi:hypothetical protein